MKYGLFGIGSGVCAEPGVSGRVAQAAEKAGFDSVWTGEHIVFPDPQEPPSPAPPEMPMLHPSTILAYLSGVTSQIKLGTGIVLIAQRNPLVLAKEIGSLDVITGGRLRFGIGAGYLHQEFAALGVDFASRGARTDEYIRILRCLWNEEKPAFDGEFFSFSNINAYPRPVTVGGARLVIGGASPAALRRTIEFGADWYGFALGVEQSANVVASLRALRAEQGCDEPIEISVTPNKALTPELSKAYADAGVDQLIPMMPQGSEQQVLDYVGQLAVSLEI